MPPIHFKSITNISLIRTVPRELFVSLLDRFGQGCPTLVNVRGLLDGPVSEGLFEALVKLFTEKARKLPGDLLRALHDLDDMADDAGFDLLCDEARRQGVTVPLIGDGSRVLPFAIKVYLDYPRVFQTALEKRLFTIVSNYREFRPREYRRLPLPSEDRRIELSARLGAFFKERGRTDFCEVHGWVEEDELRFVVRHGRPAKTDESIEEPDEKEDGEKVAYQVKTIPLRHPKHDVVVYDNHVGRLKVNASDAPTIDQYVQEFGWLLCDDVKWFQRGQVVSLAPIRELGPASLEKTSGIDNVRLTELVAAFGDDQETVITLAGTDVFKVIAEHAPEFLTRGYLRSAKLLVRYQSGGRERKVILKPPCQIEYDPRREDDTTKRFLEKRGFRAGPEPETLEVPSQQEEERSGEPA